MRWRSWARDNQKEIICSMRLNDYPQPHERTNDNQVLCSTTAPKLQASPRCLSSQPSCCLCDAGFTSNSLLLPML